VDHGAPGVREEVAPGAVVLQEDPHGRAREEGASAVRPRVAAEGALEAGRGDRRQRDEPQIRPVDRRGVSAGVERPSLAAGAPGQLGAEAVHGVSRHRVVVRIEVDGELVP